MAIHGVAGVTDFPTQVEASPRHQSSRVDSKSSIAGTGGRCLGLGWMAMVPEEGALD